jgi:hypothetical protein
MYIGKERQMGYKINHLERQLHRANSRSATQHRLLREIRKLLSSHREDALNEIRKLLSSHDSLPEDKEDMNVLSNFKFFEGWL